MKKTIIDGIEYRLIEIKKESKSFALFTLSMPNNNSWNGRWSGESNLHAITRKAFRGNKPIYPLLKEDGYFYDFGDGWGASISVSFITPSEAKKINRMSKGFCGYDWMVDEIVSIGRIRTLEEKKK